MCPECQTVLTIDGDYAYVPLPHSDVAPAGPQVEGQQETPPPFHPEGTGGQLSTPSIAEITGQEHDPLYDEAVDYLRTCNAASAPKLAQYFHISIERAQHLIADLEKNHIVGPYNGGGPREILIPHNTDLPSGQRRTYEDDQQMQALIDEYRNEKVNVPILGLVENMAWFTPAELPDHKYYLFGREGVKRLAEEMQVPLLGQIPIVQSICESGDEGEPVAVNADTMTGQAFRQLAQAVVEATERRNSELPPTGIVEMKK